MKAQQNLAKTRSATNKKKAAVGVSRKRIRRLQQLLEDDDDDEEVEEELSTSLSQRSVEPKRRSTDADNSSDFDCSFLIDFDSLDGGQPADSGSSTVLNTVCDRDIDHHPLQSDELDQVQFELEKELAQAVLTQRSLRSALRQLSTTLHGNAQTSTTTSKSSSTTTFLQKRKFPKNQQQLPKRPASAGISTSFSSVSAAKRNRASGNKDKKPFGHDSTPTCSRSYYYAQQNHQMPDKFWTFVDQYAAPITSSESLDYLRGLVQECDPKSPASASFYEIPGAKGKRRPSSSASATTARNQSMTKSEAALAAKTNSKSKAASEVKIKQESPTHGETITKASKNSESSKKRTVAISNLPASQRLRHSSRTQNGTTSAKATGKVTDEDNGVSLGPYTERLVQALLEDYGNTSNHTLGSNKNGQTSVPKNGPLASGASSKTLMKTLNMGNFKALENRIKKELIEQGLLAPDNSQADSKQSAVERGESSRRSSLITTHDRPPIPSQLEECPDDDEVTAELKRRQYELLCIQHMNHERLSNILTQAEAQVDKSQKEEMLKSADEEVLDLCSRYYGVAPASRKPNGKKERDALWKALKERQKAITNLKNVE